VKFDSRDLALTAVFAALYVIINLTEAFFVGGPVFTYGPVQLRLADCLIALAVLFGWPLVGGVTLGCVLTNAYYFIGAPDVILGPIANLVAASLVMFLRKHRLIACIAGALPVGVIVGSYLWLFFPPPAVLSFLPAWAAMIASITISSLIAVSIVGYVLLLALSRRGIIEPLKSRGLKVVDQK
jgi:uncharacterized membrane protein